MPDCVRVHGLQPKALGRTPVVEVVQQLIDNHLPLAGRVTAIHHKVSLAQQSAHDFELLLGFRVRFHLPLSAGEEWQGIKVSPFSQLWVIGLRRRLADQMPDCPCHDVIAHGHIAISTLNRPVQRLCYVHAHAGFLSDKQSHVISSPV